jgi:hypothetical protein
MHLKLRGGSEGETSDEEDEYFELFKQRLSGETPLPDWKQLEKERKERMQEM